MNEYLSIQELSNHIRWLQSTNRKQILFSKVLTKHSKLLLNFALLVALHHRNRYQNNEFQLSQIIFIIISVTLLNANDRHISYIYQH